MICSKQATSHKLGFTLSELLVSFAVLGLIAGLTVPSIVTSVDRSKNKALFKETFQLISEITYNGVINGDFANLSNDSDWWYDGPSNAVNYISSKLNYSKQCFTGDTTSDGCHLNSETNYTYGNHNARWILTNGVKVQAVGNGWADSLITHWVSHNSVLKMVLYSRGECNPPA